VPQNVHDRLVKIGAPDRGQMVCDVPRKKYEKDRKSRIPMSESQPHRSVLDSLPEAATGRSSSALIATRLTGIQINAQMM
jgi:hypothetical protein